MHHVTHHGIRSLTAGESENQSRTHSHTNQSTDECDDRRSVFAMQPIRGTPSRMLHLDTTCATSSGFPVGNASATDTTLPVLDHRSLPRSGNIAKRAGRILILLPGGDDARRAGRRNRNSVGEQYHRGIRRNGRRADNPRLVTFRGRAKHLRFIRSRLIRSLITT